MIEINPLPAFEDNYIWLLRSGDEALVVDPGDAEVVERALAAQNLRLVGVLVTHHHPDHTGGLAGLSARWPVTVYGPRAEAGRIAGLTRLLDDGARISALGLDFEVLSVPGHTLGHIAYYAPEAEALFCGDTLFSGGCGRLFEGSPAQMLASLSRLAALPPHTRVYCTHEYTLSNLAFARAVEPDNAETHARTQQVRLLRSQGLPSLPSLLLRERAFNPFLRVDQPGVRAAVVQHAGAPLEDAVEVFAALRRWKDVFRPDRPL